MCHSLITWSCPCGATNITSPTPTDTTRCVMCGEGVPTDMLLAVLAAADAAEAEDGEDWLVIRKE